jgi:hypothetical protein
MSTPPIPIRLTDTELLAVKLAAFPYRRCSRLTKAMNCCFCNERIWPGENYRDGGLKQRAHVRCVAQIADSVQVPEISGEAEGTGA